MNTSTRPDSWELGDYGRALRRRWRVVVALTLLGLLIAAAIVEVAPKTYTATASVYVNALPTDSQTAKGGATAVDMDNEAQIAQSGAVSRLAAKQLHLSTSPQLTVTVPPNTTVLDIACDASTANRAAACANAAATAYLSIRRSDAANTFTNELAGLRSKGVSLLPGVVKASVQSKAPSTTPSTTITHQLEAKAATNQLDALMSRMSFLTAELASLEAPHSTMAGHVVDAATSPPKPSSPKKTLLLPSGLVAGLLAGLILALALEVRDKRLHDARDVERIYDLPALLDLRAKRGKGKRRKGKRGKGAADLRFPAPKSVLAFTELADYVATTPTEGTFVLLVSGATPDQGTSSVAANLAAALSDLRPDVFLVCAGPGATLVPQVLGLQRRGGLAELLAGDGSIDGATQVPGQLVDLRVIGPGANGASAGPVRHNYDARRKLMAGLRAQARYVIVEAPLTSGESGPPVLTLAEFADAAVVVVESMVTERDDLDALLRHLERLRVPVLGSVVMPRLDYAAVWPSMLNHQAAEPKLDKLAVQA